MLTKFETPEERAQRAEYIAEADFDGAAQNKLLNQVGYKVNGSLVAFYTALIDGALADEQRTPSDNFIF